MRNPIAICQWVLPEPDDKPFKQAAMLGIDGLVMDFKIDGDDSLMKNEVRERVMEDSAETGVFIPTLAVNAFIHTAMTDPANHAQLLEVAHQAIETAKFMNIRKLQIPSFVRSLIHTEYDVDNTIELLKDMVKLGEDHDVVIGSENVMTVAQNLRMLEAIDSDHFGILFDTQNPWRMMSQDGVHIAKYLKDHVIEIHAKDSSFDYGTKQKSFELLGEGDVNFYGSMKVFRDIKFDGYIVLESPYALAKEMAPIFAIQADVARIRMI